jgi:hypothetical protein
LRLTIRTVAYATKDRVAVGSITDHARYHMASTYRERIGDDRLRAFTEHVRRWLFATENVETKPG